MEKKTYIIPSIKEENLGCGEVCQQESIIVGSGVSDEGRGNGTDLVKDAGDWDIWGE